MCLDEESCQHEGVQIEKVVHNNHAHSLAHSASFLATVNVK